jgi:DNA-binding beta-propeller fold protein YncE
MTRNSILAVFAVAVAMVMSGCSSSSANIVTISVVPSEVTVLAGQVENYTATVSGSTTLTVTWACSFIFTPLPTTAVPNPITTKPAPCTSGQTVNGGSIGTFTTSSTNGSNVLTYTAPALGSFPNPIPQVTFTATADADKKKTATGIADLDSGIRVSISPLTATVPVGITPPQTASFNASLLNTNPSTVVYHLVQPDTASKNTLDQSANPLSDQCDPGCGTIDKNGTYTAPATIPTSTISTVTPTSVSVVAFSSQDTLHFALATITLVNATTNPVSFSGLYPPFIAAGGILQDVFLNAKNLLNTTQINFVPPTAAANLTASSGTPLSLSTQVFTIPRSTAYCTPSATNATPVVNCDASIMTRVRLQAPQLATAEPDPTQPAWIMIPSIPSVPGAPPLTAPAGCVLVPVPQGSPTAIACQLHIVNASPALVSAVPDSFPQVSGLGTISLGAIGGYYGSTGGLVNLTFNDQATLVNTSLSGPRSLFGTKDNGQLPNPGLYEVSITSSSTQWTPPMFPTSTTNVAVQPNFATFTPNQPSSAPQNCTFPPPPAPPALPPVFPACTLLNGTGNPAPSAIALNSVGQYAVIAEQGTNALQLVDLSTGAPLQSGNPVALAAVSSTPPAPTDIAIDNQLSVNGGDLAVIVGSGDSTLYLYSVTPSAPTPLQFLKKTISLDLHTLLQEPNATGLATPYAVGVDPGTHLGVVAYSNTNIAFIVDVNPNLDGADKRTCFLAGQTPPCVIAPTSINTGPTPRVVMQPQVPLAYVTPGGGFGSTSVVDLLQQGVSVQILPASTTGPSGATRTAGITTIRTQTPHGINPILGGTVIISGVTTKTANSNFNGTNQIIQIIDPFTFTYAQTGQPDDTETNTSTALGTVQYGVPFFSFSTSANVSGAAINPITRTFAFADFNQASAQIGFISTLDQTLTSLSLNAGSCIGCTPPAIAPERGFRAVAFDPFTNVLIAFNPSENSDINSAGNEISLINPGGPAPNGGTNAPYRIIAAINTGQTGTGSYTPSGQTTPISVFGAMAYDPKTKFILVANAGSNTLSSMNLDPANTFQKTHIQALLLKDNVPSYGVPLAQPVLGSLPSTSCSLTDPKQPCMPQAVRVGQSANQSANLRILGQGFTAGGPPIVRLDGFTSITPPGATTPTPLPAPTSVTDSEIDITIPAAFLFTPHDYALDVQTNSGSTTSNSIDLHVVGILDLAGTCAASPQGPEGVAIDESRQIALITNFSCNTVSVIAINPSGFVKKDGSKAPFGTILGSVNVGKNPIGIGVIPRMGLAVVANHGDTPNGTAQIIDITNPESPAIVSWSVTSGTTTTTANTVTVGFFPLGVTVDQDRALALVTNAGSNTLSSIDLTVLTPSDPTSSTGIIGHVQGAPAATTVALSGSPSAIAVDPNRAIAVITSLQNPGSTSVTGGLDVVTLATNPPIKSSTASISSLSASITGIVYDPAPAVAVFYATSTQQNAIYLFDPDTGSVGTIRVGINPYSLGYNYQTGTLLTINSVSNSSSVVDSQNLKTRQTLGISSMSQFAIAVDNFTNTAVIVDQNNNRVVFLNLPK